MRRVVWVRRAVRPAGLALAITLALAGSAGEPSAEGYWKGTIGVAADKPIDIMVDVASKDAGWRVRFYAPVQGIHGVELVNIEIAGRSVGFRIPQSIGDPTFKGELAGDGKSISGKFDNAGETLPFHLTRAERPAGLDVDIYAEYRQPGTVGEGLAGNWRGLLMTGPNRMRLRLDVDASCDGLKGTLISLDQGDKAMPVDSFKLEGTEVRFEMLDIGALYKGTMRPDGSEFFGVWVQDGTEFPVTFRRIKQEPGSHPPG